LAWMLIAQSSIQGLLSQVVLILEVAVAIGAVIFVHELGHFAVAKWCGVKCEKFYLGFDLFGLKLFRFQYGETEYGIGILPLGGYVKMLGQEDNPSRAAEEIERAKVIREAGEQPLDFNETAPTEVAEPVAYDPRSYLAQSVPKRMAIISAGVVMNVIFAFAVAVAAYLMGVPYIPAQISRVLPGSPAWRAGLQPGDDITRIGDTANPRYTDLKSEVVLSDLDAGIEMSVQRPGQEGSLSVHLVPDRKGGERLMPTIGVLPPQSLELSPGQPVWPDSPAGRVEPPLESGDELIAADGTELENYLDWLKLIHRDADRPIDVTVRSKATREDESSPSERTVTLAANPMRTLGLTMTAATISAVQDGSPAAKSGVLPGDRLLSIDDEPVGDPLRLSQRLSDRAGETLTLQLEREDVAEPVELPVVVRETQLFDWPVPVADDDSPVTIPELGIGIQVTTRIAEIDADGPAAGTELAVGDTIVEARIILPDGSVDEDLAKLYDRISPVDFRGDKRQFAWTGFFFTWLQLLPQGAEVELETANEKMVRLAPAAADDWFNPERGFNFAVLEKQRRAASLGEAISLGYHETINFVTQVYELIEKLVGNQVSPKVLGGPLTIIDAAGGAASRGLPDLLIFLGMLSANLAVINFLPIPVLDGGHMLFLIVEGIRGKPAGEKLTIALHYAGFLLILTLMGFVLFLDFQRLDWFG